MSRKSSLTILSAILALLLASAPAVTAADSTMSGNDAWPAKSGGGANARNMKDDMTRMPRDMLKKTNAEQRGMQPESMRPSSDTINSDLAERARRALESYNGITVEARDGEVSVSGTVRTGSERSDILKRIRQVQGVRSVNDELTVSHNGSEGIGAYIDDASVTAVVKGRFLGQEGIDFMDISVETTNGIVTLTGEVENRPQISMAEGVAKNADGVKGVVNHLTYRQ